MFERFSEKLNQIIVFAEQEMRRTGHCSITVPHLFLAMVAHGDNPAASIISAENIRLDDLRANVDSSLGQSEGSLRKGICLDDNTQAIIEFAEDIAFYGGDPFLQPEHVFASMLLRNGSTIIIWLRCAGVLVADADALALQIIDDYHLEQFENVHSSEHHNGHSSGRATGLIKRAKRVEDARILVNELAQKRGPRKSLAWSKWEQSVAKFYEALKEVYPEGFWENFKRLKEGQADAVEMALEFLEADPWFFRSGYLKADLIKYICRATLTSEHQNRLRTVALQAVDSRDRREFRAYCRLARKIIDNDLRIELLKRIQQGCAGVRRRAQWMIDACVKNH